MFQFAHVRQTERGPTKTHPGRLDSTKSAASIRIELLRARRMQSLDVPGRDLCHSFDRAEQSVAIETSCTLRFDRSVPQPLRIFPIFGEECLLPFHSGRMQTFATKSRMRCLAALSMMNGVASLWLADVTPTSEHSPGGADAQPPPKLPLKVFPLVENGRTSDALGSSTEDPVKLRPAGRGQSNWPWDSCVERYSLGEPGEMTNPDETETADPAEEVVRSIAQAQRRLFAFILTLVRRAGDAEDILQETNVVLWRKRETFRPGSDFYAWAFEIARWQFLAWRSRQNRQGSPLDAALLC